MKNKRYQREDLRIPVPDLDEHGYKFYPLVRLSKYLPFGYVEDENDPTILLPVEKELVLLEQAKKYLQAYSLRDVAAWLSEKSGRYISHTGLGVRVKAEQSYEKEFIQTRALAKKFREAYHKAYKIQNHRLGLREPTEEEIDNELYKGLDQTLKRRY